MASTLRAMASNLPAWAFILIAMASLIQSLLHSVLPKQTAETAPRLMKRPSVGSRRASFFSHRPGTVNLEESQVWMFSSCLTSCWEKDLEKVILEQPFICVWESSVPFIFGLACLLHTEPRRSEEVGFPLGCTRNWHLPIPESMDEGCAKL